MNNMRVKFKTGNSFVQTTAYVLGATKDQKPEILICNGVEINLADGYKLNEGKLSRRKIYQIARYIGKSFEIQAKCHPLKKPVRHYIMTFPPEDKGKLEDSSKMMLIIKEYMKEQGMLKTQYLVVRHNNTEHPHVHIVFNPINNNLEVIKQSVQFKKNEKLCKELTKKYGLHFSDPRKFKVKDYKKIAKHERHKAHVRCAVEQALQSATSIPEFRDFLKNEHIQVRAKFIEKEGKKCLKGLIFLYDVSNNKTIHFKASQLSRSLRAQVITDILAQNKIKISAQLEDAVKEEEKINIETIQPLREVRPPMRRKSAVYTKKPKSFGPKM